MANNINTERHKEHLTEHPMERRTNHQIKLLVSSINSPTSHINLTASSINPTVCKLYTTPTATLTLDNNKCNL